MGMGDVLGVLGSRVGEGVAGVVAVAHATLHLVVLDLLVWCRGVV